MVVRSEPATLDHNFSLIPTCESISKTNPSVQIPVVDLSDPEAKTRILKACEDFGFFKVVNHDVRPELITRLENEALKFFALPQAQKDKAGPPDPFGYGSKRIGPNGDVGWIEYIFLNANPQVTSLKSLAVFQESPGIFRSAVAEYMVAVKEVACTVLELMAEGLGLSPRETLSQLLKDEKSDSSLRLNHYPECTEEEAEVSMRLSGNQDQQMVGFGEHTDPQIISVLRSNNTSGLQICLRDGRWLAVSPDHSSFFVNVGDALQVMTNGRFKSIKHRVLTDTKRSRMSMVYFGGPPLSQKITALPSLVPTEETQLYKEFTWSEYKLSAYRSRLADNRLALFEKNTQHQHS